MLALGLNSGSSFDGIGAVLVDIDVGENGHLKRPRFIAGKTVDWPKRVADQVLVAFENKLSIFELCRLNYVAGLFTRRRRGPLCARPRQRPTRSRSSASTVRPSIRSPPILRAWLSSLRTRTSSDVGSTVPIHADCRSRNPRSSPQHATRRS